MNEVVVALGLLGAAIIVVVYAAVILALFGVVAFLPVAFVVGLWRRAHAV